MTEIRNLNQRISLGRTGLQVSRLGIAASYGVDGTAVEEAYHERGINLLYWGSLRRKTFGEAIRRLAKSNREDLVIVIQSYSRLSWWLEKSLERALRQLDLQYADILLLGMFNRPPSLRVMEKALQLKNQGKARFIAVSCHRRVTFQRYIADGAFDVLMFRYNATHRGAETEILPFLPDSGRPGTFSYTATRWGTLINPKKMPPGVAAPRASDCYRFVLTQPSIDVCLTGPANRDQLREALAALDRGPMAEDELAWMKKIGDHIRTKALRG